MSRTCPNPNCGKTNYNDRLLSCAYCETKFEVKEEKKSLKEKCMACQNSRPIWYAGIIGLITVTLSVLFIFEQIDLNYFAYNQWWIFFIVWHGIGFAIAGILTTCGIWLVKEFCKHRDDGGSDTNIDNALRLGIMIGMFTACAIVLSLMAFNFDNSYWETMKQYQSVRCDEVPENFKYSCTKDIEQIKTEEIRTGKATIFEYVTNDLENDPTIPDSALYVKPILDNLFENEDCDGLIEWRINNYNQGARTYAGHLINDLDCLELELIVDPTYEYQGLYEKIELTSTSINRILDEEYKASREYDCKIVNNRIDFFIDFNDDIRPVEVEQKEKYRQIINKWEERSVEMNC